jgi:hypothetical protein
MSPADEFATFVVRLSRVDGGRLAGVVERVRTGEKASFHELEAIGTVIGRLLDGGSETERQQPSTDTRRTRT